MDTIVRSDQITVDIRFTSEGVSASAYGISEEPAHSEVLEEAWFTWAGVDDLTTDAESHVTFEFPAPRCQHAETVEIPDNDA